MTTLFIQEYEADMQPTPKLRFVIRYEPTPIHVLQQWWQDIDFNPSSGEWRDVPLEKEE